jgi:hypothetical protein
MAENKAAAVNIRVHKSLKKSFDAEIGRCDEFSGSTDFFEQAMAALVNHARRGGKIAIPLAFLTEEDEAKLRVEGK